VIEYLLYGAVLLGLAAGAFIVAQRPSFWAGFAVVIFKAALPIILRRKSADDERKWRDSLSHGGSGRFDKWGKEIDDK
jgi:hypothetical protein